MTNHEEIAGFQFRIDNFYIDNISDIIGTAIDNDFAIQHNSDGIFIGFSLIGATIQPGSDILLRFSFSDYISGTISCINDIILSDSSGNSANVSYFSDQNNNCIAIE